MLQEVKQTFYINHQLIQSPCFVTYFHVPYGNLNMFQVIISKDELSLYSYRLTVVAYLIH